MSLPRDMREILPYVNGAYITGMWIEGYTGKGAVYFDEPLGANNQKTILMGGKRYPLKYEGEEIVQGNDRVSMLHGTRIHFDGHKYAFDMNEAF